MEKKKPRTEEMYTADDWVEAIKILRPGAKYRLRGNQYSGLEWWDEDQTKPTEEEITDALPQGKHNVCLFHLKRKRNALLASCDWTQMPDVDLDQETKDNWTTYRQALRDLPDKYADKDVTPLDYDYSLLEVTGVDWPTKP